MVGVLVFLYLTLQAMQSNIVTPVEPQAVKYEGRTVIRSEAPMDSSMKKMLEDIYGE